MPSARYQLPDGRTLIAGVLDIEGTNEDFRAANDDLGPLWELAVEEETIAGRPLNSTLAALLGWDVANEEWPEWIDELAERISQDVG